MLYLSSYVIFSWKCLSFTLKNYSFCSLSCLQCSPDSFLSSISRDGVLQPGQDPGSPSDDIKEERNSDSVNGQTKLDDASPPHHTSPSIYTDLQKASALPGGALLQNMLPHNPGVGQGVAGVVGMNNGSANDVGQMLTDYQALWKSDWNWLIFISIGALEKCPKEKTKAVFHSVVCLIWFNRHGCWYATSLLSLAPCRLLDSSRVEMFWFRPGSRSGRHGDVFLKRLITFRDNVIKILPMP